MKDKTQTLAKQMGVTVKDVESLLNMVANSIERAGQLDRLVTSPSSRAKK
jgi:hypothetical protein